MIIIDYQPVQVSSVLSMDRRLLVENIYCDWMDDRSVAGARSDE